MIASQGTFDPPAAPEFSERPGRRLAWGRRFPHRHPHRGGPRRLPPRLFGLAGDELMVLHGLGATPEEILAAIVADARKVQADHRDTIDRMADREKESPGILGRDDEMRNAFSNRLAWLRNGFVERGLKAVGVSFPFQLDRTTPAHAILIAVRDDLQETISLLDQKKWQALVIKEIRELPQFGLTVPGGFRLPGFPKIPWYVWGGALFVGGLLVLPRILELLGGGRRR